MGLQTRDARTWGSAILMVTAVFWMPQTAAQNEAFQNFFFDACTSAGGALAARCAQTDDGDGNVSGDSESSLNPSQALSGADSAFFAAQQRVQDMGESLESRRDGSDGATRVEIGPWGFLLNGRTTQVEAERDANRDAERAYELDEVGIDIGFDYRVSDTLIAGVLLNWADSELTFDQEANGTNFNPTGDAGRMDSDALGVTLFLSSFIGESGFIDASLGFSQLDMDLTRNAIFQESNRVVPQEDSVTTAQADSDQFFAMINVGRSYRLGGFDVTPSLGLSHIATGVDGYTETDVSGSGLAMEFATEDRDSTFGHLGVSAAYPISMEGWVLLPQGSIDYVAELSHDEAVASASYVEDAGDNVFAFVGADDDRSRVDWSLGAVGVFQNGWMAFLEYQQSSGMDEFERYSVVAGIRVEL